MQEVRIKLTAKHLVEGNEEETIHDYTGRCVKKENAWYLTYREQMEGIGEVGTTLRLEEKSVTLVRQGQVSSRQQFEKGKSTHSVYRSPYGPFDMETHTNKLRIQVQDGMPRNVEIAYQLWMSGQYAGEHRLQIQINP
ncbi:DUF1934 domain-containing protein [Brevibacillus panacihumi]|uniref:DUF1934 domain-containing protein n=1 Tax=Brevibacillus panacihumi TaxID=497735 RepID=UPI003CFC612A